MLITTSPVESHADTPGANATVVGDVAIGGLRDVVHRTLVSHLLGSGVQLLIADQEADGMPHLTGGASRRGKETSAVPCPTRLRLGPSRVMVLSA
jgi:hypothetical protein